MNRVPLAKLSPVEQTLLIPLACRIRESQRSDRLLYDPRALTLLDLFGEEALNQERISPFDQVSTILRARRFDRYARCFLSSHPDGMIVDIGCGLDTRFDRLNHESLIWYGIDLPEVIDLRRMILPDTERSHSIACSVLDFGWMDTVAAHHLPVIFLAEGIFPYFDEADVKRLVLAIAECFPGAELVFDGLSRLALKMHQLPGQSLRGAAALLRWGFDDPHTLEQWGMGIRLLDQWFYYEDQEPRRSWFNSTRFFPPFGKASRVVHYQLGVTS